MSTNPSCSNIDHLLYLTDDEITPSETLSLARHLESCPDCRKTRESFLLTRRKTLLVKNDIPSYPDFIKSTEILINSGITSTHMAPVIPMKQVWHKTISITRYAASICAVFLILLFITEQTGSIRKISELENRIQSTSNPLSPGLTDRLALARTVFATEEWTEFAAGLNVSQNSDDPVELKRIRDFLENRMRLKINRKPAFMTSYRLATTMKRTQITFNNLIK